MQEEFAEKKDIYYCPICAKKELNSLGEAYIHREHQLQGILICPHDGCVLQRYPTRKLDVSRVEYIRLDINTLELNKDSFKCKFYDKLFKLAKDGYYLLANDLSFSNLEKIEECYKRLLLKKGMVTTNGTIKRSKLYKAFVDCFGEGFLKFLESDIKFENEYNWLKVMTRGNKRASHPLRNLLFIEFISQNAEEFFQELKANTKVVVTRNTALITYKVEDANVNIINRYRENIIGYLRKNSKVNRTELRRSFQKEYTYLYRYDNEWLFKNLPRKVEKIKATVNKVNWQTRDIEYVEAINQRYDDLINAVKPTRITKGTLAKTLGILPNVEKNINKLPKTKALLEELCESVKEFQIRRCKVIIDKYINDNEEIKLWQVQRIAAVKSIYFKEIKKELENYINEKNKEVQEGRIKLKLKDWPFDTGEKVQLIWIGEPFKHNNKWMIDTYFCDGKETKKIIQDWANIHFLSIDKYYVDGDLNSGQINDKDTNMKIINIDLSGIKPSYYENDWNIRRSDFKGKSRTFNFYKNKVLYSIPVIEIVRSILAPNIFMLNTILYNDILENYYTYNFDNDVLKIFFSRQYRTSYLKSEYYNHLAWLLSNKKLLNTFNSIGYIIC